MSYLIMRMTQVYYFQKKTLNPSLIVSIPAMAVPTKSGPTAAIHSCPWQDLATQPDLVAPFIKKKKIGWQARPSCCDWPWLEPGRQPRGVASALFFFFY